MNLCQGPAFPHRCTWSPERRSQVLKENFKTHNTVCARVPLGSSEITRCRKHNREIWVLPLESVPCLSFPGASPHLCQLFPGLQTFISYKGERSPAWPDAGEKLHYPVCTERATSQERGRSGPVGRGGISGVARRKRLRRGARFLHSGAEFSAAGRSEQGGTAGRPHLRLRGFWVGSLSPRAPPCGPARHRSDGGALGPGAGEWTVPAPPALGPPASRPRRPDVREDGDLRPFALPSPGRFSERQDGVTSAPGAESRSGVPWGRAPFLTAGGILCGGARCVAPGPPEHNAVRAGRSSGRRPRVRRHHWGPAAPLAEAAATQTGRPSPASHRRLWLWLSCHSSSWSVEACRALVSPMPAFYYQQTRPFQIEGRGGGGEDARVQAL